jgi:hypothetical protein
MNNITKPVEKSGSLLMTLGRIGVFAGAGYLLWTNRFRIQRFLEAQGIETPWMNGNVGEAIASGASKVGGAIQHEVKSFGQPNNLSNVSKDINKAAHN